MCPGVFCSAGLAGDQGFGLGSAGADFVSTGSAGFGAPHVLAGGFWSGALAGRAGLHTLGPGLGGSGPPGAPVEAAPPGGATGPAGLPLPAIKWSGYLNKFSRVDYLELI